MSIVLLLAALYGVMRAAMLCFIPVNRTANRVLACLIIVLALYTFPYIAGYAGYYDAYPWLSFFPYKLTLAIGPLLYLYMACLATGGPWPAPRWWLHLAPALLQLLYYSVLFAQPLALKNSWDAQVHMPLVDKLESAAVLLSLAIYWTLARRAAPASEWTRNLLIASGLTVAAFFILAGAEMLTGGLGYFQRFPFYLWLAVLVCYLGTEGCRHGASVLAVMAAPAPPAPGASAPVPAAAPTAPAAPAPPTQAEVGERWRAMVFEGRWWRNPELTLASLAQRLGTNTTALSRAMNEGLGLNFNEMINRMRVDAVVTALQQAGEDQAILDIALAEGFNSKASFNRAFKLYTGKTPSDYRRARSAQDQVSDSA